MSIVHAYSQTVADGTATSVVRPSDWNSAHNMVLNMGGNTAGTSQISGQDIVWAGGNNVTLSANGSTVSIVGPNTVAQTVQTQASGNIAGQGFSSTTTAGTAIVATHNSAGLSMGVPAYLTTAGATNAITTAALSNHSHNLATTTTNGSLIVVGTTNSAGATLAVPAFLTTYAAQTNQTQASGNIAGVGTTFAGTNVSASMTLNSAGLNLALSAPAGGGTINQTGPNIAVAGSTITSGDVLFSNANGVTFGMNGSTITASVAAGGGGGGVTLSDWYGPAPAGFSSLSSHTATAHNGSMFIGLELLPAPIQFTQVAIVQGHSVVSSYNVAQTGSMTVSFGVYSKVNSTQLSLHASGSQSWAITWSSSTTTGVMGMRELYLPVTATLSQGEWYMARIMSYTGNNASAATAHTISHFGIPMQTAISGAADGFGVATNSTEAAFAEWQGRYTTTTNAFPNSIGASHMTYTGTNALWGNFFRHFEG